MSPNRQSVMGTVDLLLDKLAARKIWNVDYVEAKYPLERAFEKDARDLRQALMNLAVRNGCSTTEFHSTFPGAWSIYESIPYGLYGMASFAKKLSKIKGAMPAGAATMAAMLVDDWGEVAGLLFVDLKPFIVKGRKPSENPTKTPPRTLEGTGTCPVCGRNIKITPENRMVHHGYVVRAGGFEGDCFGVGHLAWEISNQGALEFRAYVATSLERLEAMLKSLPTWPMIFNSSTRKTVKRGEPHFDELIAAKTRETKFDIRRFGAYIDDLDTKIASWAPDTLPGIKAGFKR